MSVLCLCQTLEEKRQFLHLLNLSGFRERSRCLVGLSIISCASKLMFYTFISSCTHTCTRLIRRCCDSVLVSVSVLPWPPGSGQSPPAGAAAQLPVSAVPQEVQLQRQHPEAGQWAEPAAVRQQREMGRAESGSQRGGAQAREGTSQEHAGQTAGKVSSSHPPDSVELCSVKVWDSQCVCVCVCADSSVSSRAALSQAGVCGGSMSIALWSGSRRTGWTSSRLCSSGGQIFISSRVRMSPRHTLMRLSQLILQRFIRYRLIQSCFTVKHDSNRIDDADFISYA